MNPVLEPEATPQTLPQQGGTPKPAGQEATADDPNQATPEQNQQAVQLSDREKQELMWLRRDYKLSWAPNRRARVKQVLKAFEVLKGNPYLSFDPNSFQWYDPIAAAINGNPLAADVELYKFNNNIYQMLCLSFLAALSPQVPKVRYMPEDADSELDIATARRASSMMAIIERKNKIQSLQKQELLHLWTGGCYFSYSRFVIDSDRFKTTKVPVVGLVDQQVLPDRFVCPDCGDVSDANQFVWSRPVCPTCGHEMGEEDFHPSESMPVPQEIGKQEVPNGMVLISIFGAMNVDAAPYAEDLFESPILDLEVETDIAGIRAAYPGAWSQLRTTMGNTTDAESEADRISRIQVSSSTGMRSGYLSTSLITYSRCWIQSWAFNKIEDKSIADGLKAKFPKGCKLVSAGGNEFLEAVPSTLSEEWTWCGTIRGTGLYPFAIGDAALDVQERINDVANITHEHMDRTASPTILADAEAIDDEAMNGQPMPPGRLTLVKRKGSLSNKPLSDILFQPQFHIDNQIYSYGDNLIALAQLVSGVRPEIFGGSDDNVQTASGQKQMLNQALGRLGLFWDQIREEHAARAQNAVKCFADNMDEQIKNVIEGDTDSGFENEYILLSEMQGQFHAFPESDQGFPATYAEIRDRLMELLADVNNPFVQEFLQDPDNIKTVARYVGPPEIKIPGDAMRTKVKRIIGALAKNQPFEAQPEDALMLGIPSMTPIFLPQTETGLELPDPDFDDMAMIVMECQEWGRRNFKQKQTNPAGYENVRAYLRIAAQKQAEAMAKQVLTQAAQGASSPQATPPQA